MEIVLGKLKDAGIDYLLHFTSMNRMVINSQGNLLQCNTSECLKQVVLDKKNFEAFMELCKADEDFAAHVTRARNFNITGTLSSNGEETISIAPAMKAI